MPQLPLLSSEELISILKKIGYEVARQRGSHIRLCHPDSSTHKPITVPAYKQIDRSLIRKILRDIPMTTEAFMELYK